MNLPDRHTRRTACDTDIATAPASRHRPDFRCGTLPGEAWLRDPDVVLRSAMAKQGTGDSMTSLGAHKSPRVPDGGTPPPPTPMPMPMPYLHLKNNMLFFTNPQA
ncbi:hypothetical protein [Chitiniphilus eburneus]|uniref:Uncharacterized protein n=1 Tax=Chitiniphilus eburneus TaxID=2571148 RepID=A0A4U0PY74_9NEIS|nr:hypothetical protein [Chitiniphilus eburneus]TJZ73210.1 hypothetical protein FAZ21_11370 [Chitiniphilus eburneus]